MVKLNDNFGFDLPKLLDTRLLVQANSGGGKSWLIRRLLEQSHGRVQQIVIDLEGEFSTLREKYDYILVGKDGDTPTTTKSAALLARKLLELEASAIIDLYELQHQDRKHFVKLFFNSMINAPKELWHPVIVVIDEAHIFAPEKGQSEALEAVIDLATRGRKRGYCAVLATQRISKLHKDAAAECNNKLIGRTGLDIDMKRAAEELGFTSKEQMLSLRSLTPGEFYAFGTALSPVVEKVQIGNVETSHPRAGSRALTAVIPASLKIKDIIAQLSDLPQEAELEAESVNELKNENKELKEKLKARQPEVNIEEIKSKIRQEEEGKNKVIIDSKEREFNNLKSKINRLSDAMSDILNIKNDDTVKYNTNLDINEIVKEVLNKIPRSHGNTVYEVSPIEKITKEFLLAAKDKIIISIKDLSDDAKKSLKYIESVNRQVSTNEVVTNAFLLKSGGGNNQRVLNSLNELGIAELVMRERNGKTTPYLKRRIAFLLDNFDTTDQEKEQVYDYILMEVL